MKSSDLLDVFIRNEDCIVKVDFNGAFYNVNNIFMENGILYFRSFELMNDKEKELCDVSYSDEKTEMTCEDFIGLIESYDSDKCYYSESFKKARDFSIDVVDDFVVFGLKEVVK